MACAFAFAACGSTTNEGGNNPNGGNEPEHTHEWSSVYFEEGDRHYQTCMGCKERKYGEHTYNSIGYCICGKTGPNAGGPNTGIENPPTHTHNFSRKIISTKYLKEEATCITPDVYYYCCETCGERGEETFEHGEPAFWAHDFSAEIPEEKYLEYNATCQQGAYYSVSCSRCGEPEGGRNFEYGEPVGHKFTRKERYKTAEYATCVSPEKCYYICEWCSEHGEETFEFGEPNPMAHDFSAEVPEQRYLRDNATCQSGAYYYYSCSYCGEKNWSGDVFEYGEYGNHKFDYKDSDDCYIAEAATCIAPAKYYYRCELCEEHGTETFEYGSINRDAHDYELHEGYEAIICTEMSWDDYYTCRREGCDYNSKEEHSPNTDNPAIHNFDDGICLRCNELQTKGLRYNDEGVILGVSGDVEEVVIPSKINSINITTISDSAFSRCSNLANIVIPDSITAIGDSAFDACSNLTSITIPDSVISIGNLAFYNCRSLTNITIGIKVASIGSFAFYGSGITSISIPDSVTTIGNSAFAGSKLTSITIGIGITTIGDAAFGNVMKEIKYTGDIVGWCGINDISNLMKYGETNKKLTINNKEITGELIIPNGVTSISNYAFSGCAGLTSLFVPDSVTTIGSSVFSGCDNIENAIMPTCVNVPKTNLKTVTLTTGSIVKSKFNGYDKLTSVTIRDSVTAIGDYAFSGCAGLMSITLGNGIAAIGSKAFEGCKALKEINYTGDIAGWCGISGLVNLTASNRTLYINDKELIGELVIPNGVTSISAYAFIGCSRITSVIIPSGVTSIEAGTFYDCTGLKSVTFYKSVTSIYENAFENCSSLKDWYYYGTYLDWSNNLSLGNHSYELAAATRHYVN